MELNAVAGRGEDPQAVLRRGLGGPEAQPRPSPLSQARDQRHGGRGFSSNASSRLRFAQGAEELRSVGQADWARSEGFVPGGLAPDGGGGGDATAVGSWGPAADGAGQSHFGGERASAPCLRDARAEGVGFRAYRENADDAAHHHRAPAWQQTSVEPARGGGRGGSRWGVFASERAAQGLAGHRRPAQQVWCSHALPYLAEKYRAESDF